MPETFSLDDLMAMSDCLESIRLDLAYAERVLAETNARITQMWAFTQLRLNKINEGEETPKAPATPTTPHTPWAEENEEQSVA